MSRPVYPKPGPVGGRLIRSALALLREFAVHPKAGGHILIACSGGADSVALARLIVKYGRKVAPKEAVRLVHFDHGWRGDESSGDAEFVRDLAQKWGVPCELGKGSPGASGEARSPEEDARLQRKAFFARILRSYPGVILTAHHADDLAETLLWRLFSGAGASHAGGILVRSEDHELRPLLRARRAELRRFLREEGLSHREDSTNSDARFLRARLRQELLPTIETLFPRAVTHLVEAALSAQKAATQSVDGGRDESTFAALEAIFGARGVRLKRQHFLNFIGGMSSGAPADRIGMDLPQGWRAECRSDGERAKARWVIEGPWVARD